MSEDRSSGCSAPGFLRGVVSVLNHISVKCTCVKASRRFYRDVLGFKEIRRPGSLDFDGAWLFSDTSNIGIHLIGGGAPTVQGKRQIDPRSNHLAFSTAVPLEDVREALQAAKIDFVTNTVKEADIMVEQVFLHDPDGNMIEICNCDTLPVVPLSRATSVATSRALSLSEALATENGCLACAVEARRQSRMTPSPVPHVPENAAQEELALKMQSLHPHEAPHPCAGALPPEAHCVVCTARSGACKVAL